MNSFEQRAELEAKVAELIDKDNVNSCTVSFTYKERQNLSGGILLYVSTHNPVHNTTFLYGRSSGEDEVAALKNFLQEFDKSNEEFENNYTVLWSKVGENNSQKSYFFGKNIHEVLLKFEHDKNPKDYIIFEIKLNPIT